MKRILINTAVIGDQAVGKTTFRKIYNHSKDDMHKIIGMDVGVKDAVLNGRPVTYRLCELAAEPRFDRIRSDYYRGCHGGFILHDVTRPDTFTNVERWIQELWKNSALVPVPFLLLGNKIDLREQCKNHITEEQGLSYAEEVSKKTEEHGFSVTYLDICAKSRQNADLALEMIGKQYFLWMVYLKEHKIQLR